MSSNKFGLVIEVGLLILILTSCVKSTQPTTSLIVSSTPPIRKTSIVSPSPVVSQTPKPTTPDGDSNSPFFDYKTVVVDGLPAGVARTRQVTINPKVLITEDGEFVPLSSGAEIPFYLFEDAQYVGILDLVEKTELGLVWTGQLKDIEYGNFTIVYTSGVFLFKIASPEGVYEVHQLEEQTYEIQQIDQTEFPGEF
ncbi:MAG TPA: hypothetical protein PLH64_03555 [Anaerolineaceae bacterium]|nr:hypothetical protein [Anaerolineaceae bacterium]